MSTETGILPILQLQHLLQRCDAAAAPDRLLDADVYLAVTSSAATAIRHPELPGWVTWPDADGLDLDLEVPRYTQSIDAMADLIRTALPGFWWTCGRQSGSPRRSATCLGSRAPPPISAAFSG